MNHEHWITTRSGLKFDLIDPQPDMIALEDIAWALERLCRYNGHCNRHYSVAEHSVIVSALVSYEHRMQALFHDAQEAYYGDVSSPLKALLPEYKIYEQRGWLAICDKFNLPKILAPEIEHADIVALLSEKRVIHPMAMHHSWKVEQRAAAKGITFNSDAIFFITQKEFSDPGEFVARYEMIQRDPHD